MQFGLAGLVLLALLLAVVGPALSSVIESSALQRSAEEAQYTVAPRVAARITPADLRDPMTGSRYDAFDRYVQESLVSSRTVRVKLWDPEGRVIYSSDASQVGQQFPVKPVLAQALDGTVAGELSSLRDIEHQGERHYGRLFEVYAPLRYGATGVIAGVVEIYQLHRPIQQEIEQAQTVLYAGLLAGYLAVFGVLFAVVKRRSDEARRREELLTTLVRRDYLTGLANRIAVEERLRQETRRLRRSGGALAALAIDLDGFKAINDSRGHAEGDRALQLVARSIERRLRATDFAARISGDEFLVLLPDTTVESAEAMAQRIQRQLEEVTACLDFRVTLSIGIAGFQGQDMDSTALLRSADQALYQAKEFGKNRYFAAPGLGQTTTLSLPGY
ncbi:MAG: GGDEF domain-containing protein [Chloroflexi bacterium]|nr:GGDEF domain-containing protein [Chloroflexota bacterium]